MSRTGFSAANYLQVLRTPNLYPCSMAVRFVPTASDAVVRYVFAQTASDTIGNNVLGFYMHSGNMTPVRTAGGGGSFGNMPFKPTLNDWNHAVGIWPSATQTKGYLNGSAGSFGDTITRNPSGVDRVIIGCLNGGNPSTAGTMIADAAIWDAVLTDDDARTYMAGVSPLKIRPASLVAHWPIWGVGSPEPNVVDSARSLSIVGSLSKGNSPRLLMPQGPRRR